MNPKSLLLAFSPLLLFTIVDRLVPEAAGWAALASAVLATVILVAGIRHGVKLITAASIVIFAVLALVGLFGGPGGAWFVALFGSAVCALVIGALMIISMITTPFTVPYARASVPEQYWTSPLFLRVNKQISTAWAVAVLAIGAGRLCYGLLVVATQSSVPAVLRIALSWVVPILAIVYAVRATKKIASDADKAAAGA